MVVVVVVVFFFFAIQKNIPCTPCTPKISLLNALNRVCVSSKYIQVIQGAIKKDRNYRTKFTYVRVNLISVRPFLAQ